MKATVERHRPTNPMVSTGTEADGAAGNEACPGVDEYVYKPLTTKHRRAGSTGTTGDEEYTTDEEELYADEVDSANSHPISKSDLARAATDLFGYEAKQNASEPTSLFDEDESREELDVVPNDNSSTKVAASENEDRAARKSTNPFYDSTLREVQFQTCRRPTDLGEFDGARSASSSPSSPSSSSPASEARTSMERDLEGGSNPFRSVPSESETSNNDEVVVGGRVISTETRNSIKSEVESRARQELDPARGSRDDPPSPTAVQWGRAVAEVKEQAIAKLQDELRRAHEELKLKAEEVARLSRIRQDVEAELEDLTASLFQEAHNMVREANVRQATAERLLAESRMKSEVLAAEVAALKTLVLTSTPARPNPHLHPQIDNRGRDEAASGGLFAKRHRRSPSHFNLKYGRENSPPESPVKEQRPSLPATELLPESRDGLEVDPIVHKEFLQWKANPCVDKANAFVDRIFREDIDLCLDFANKELGGKVRQAVLDGIVFVEAVSDKTKVAFPKKCALLEAPRQCHYRMRLGDQENQQWFSISQICRNRIIAVCDFLNYLRYIERGLVKSAVHDIYWEITRLRKEMVLARLGLALSS